MKTFKALLKKKLDNAEFKCFFERECHVCMHTIRIFEKLSNDGIPEQKLAGLLHVDAKHIADLRDAEYCDPELVRQLCHHLNLDIPKACPRLKKP